MKKLTAILFVLIATQTVRACDICGCGVGSYYTGILPEFSKNIFGLRYRFNSLHTHLTPNGGTSYLTTLEKFNTIDAWAGITLTPKFRLMGYIPLSINEKINQGNTTKRSGIGDIGIQGFYRLFDDRTSKGKTFFGHSLWVGAGVKLPTGDYETSQKDGTGQSANTFQLGTGSVDFTLNMMYDLRVQDFGVNATANYKMNTTNKDQYRYGNKLSSTVQGYYKIRVKNKFTIAPNAGVAFETAAKDEDEKLIADATGGNISLLTAGAEFTKGKVAIGGNFQTPMAQELAKGSVKAGDRVMIHISLML
jgi:hypothetical protein